VITPIDVLQTTSEPTAPPAYLYHIPLPGAPLDERELERLRRFVHELVGTLSSAKSLAPQYFVRMRRLDKEPWSDLMSANSQFWRVKVGLGIHPGKPLPAPPTLRDVFSMKAMVLPELTYKIDTNPYIHTFLPNCEIPSPTNVYLGCGGCEVFLVANTAEFLPEAKKVFAEKLHPSYGGFDFYVPLLGLKDFTCASPDTIRLWFALFEVFIAEVRDEPGLLVASREPIAQPLAALQYILDGVTDYGHR
jgi:hypothetical protein